MSPAILTPLFDHGAPAYPSNHQHLRTPSIASSGYSRSTMTFFNRLRQKSSRKSSIPLGEGDNAQQTPKRSSQRGSVASQDNNPFISTAPATRRPDRPGMNAFTTPSNEPPPPYSPPGSTSANAVAPVQTIASAPAVPVEDDDAFDFLRTFDTVFLIDDSGSMAGYHWRQTREALKTITPICTKYDQDGIDIYFLNFRPSDLSYSDNPVHPSEMTPDHFQNIKDADKVDDIFEMVKPRGATPTGRRLKTILDGYLKGYHQDIRNKRRTRKPMNIIVITDGAATDDVESVLIDAAKKLDEVDAEACQVGVQFFQVGNDPEAREQLKELDDGLREASGIPNLRDIVDTVPFTGANGGELTGRGILKVVLGSVHKRLDRNSTELHRR